MRKSLLPLPLILLTTLCFSINAQVAPGKILAQWDFSDSAIGEQLELRGGTTIIDGALVNLNDDTSKPGGAVEKKRDPRHTPPDAFDFEAVFSLSGAFKRNQSTPSLFYDSKYVVAPNQEEKNRPYHSGFMVGLKPAGAATSTYRIFAVFGYGQNSASAESHVIQIPTDTEHTVVMSFNGTGRVSFQFDGKAVGVATIAPGVVSPAQLPVCLGDRIGSVYQPFGGAIRRITLRQAEYHPITIMLQRKVFERGEGNGTLLLHPTLYNFTDTPLENLSLAATFAGQELKPKTPSIAAHGQMEFVYPIDSWGLEQSYPLEMTLRDENGEVLAAQTFDVTIVPAYGDFMTVLLWGYDPDNALIHDIGFTHQSCVGFTANGPYDPKNRPADMESLDTLLKAGLYGYCAASTKYRFEGRKRFLRTDRQGVPYPRLNAEASNPALRDEYAADVKSSALALGDHPAWDMALINSEVRDGTRPSFGGTEPADFKQFAGYDIPEQVTMKYPISHRSRPDFPWDRIIAADSPEQVFYHWFWREGDGWNTLQTLLSDTLHRHIHHHFTTFFDPAVRVPPLWGSGGHVDMLNQWTYAYPDPIKIAQATDEIAAMAAGRPGQKLSSMTQVICYRSQIAPQNVEVANPPKWLETEKDAAFITIPPDILRIAFWSKISRRLDAIMYHGTGSLLGPLPHSYRYTNGDTKVALKELLNGVVKPLGPVLKKVPEYTPEIAILESFTANLHSPALFAEGWSVNWAADLHLALQWAALQPRIYYEEHFLQDKVAKLPAVLFVPSAEVLDDQILAKLQELQRKGVVLVGDEYTTPALMVDLRIHSVPRVSTDPEGTKKALQKLGSDIAAMLKGIYEAPMKTDNPDIVLYRRGRDGADYCFALNDKRTFGDYVGQWRRLMEDGLPNHGTVTISHGTKAAYDLVNHRSVPFRSDAASTVMDLDFAAAEGKIILLLKDQSIHDLTFACEPSQPAKGESCELIFQIVDDNGKPVNAILPLEIAMTDANGNRLPPSGFHAAVDGTLRIQDVVPPNMAAGTVNVHVRCLASGLQRDFQLTVK